MISVRSHFVALVSAVALTASACAGAAAGVVMPAGPTSTDHVLDAATTTSVASLTTTTPTTTTTTATTPTTSSSSTTAPSTTAPSTTAPSTTAPSTTTTVLAGSDVIAPRTMLVIGDSTAAALADGLVGLANERVDLDVVVAARNGCGLVTVGEYHDDMTSSWRPVPSGCVTQAEQVVPSLVAELRPDVVVAMVTSWDVARRRWSDGVETDPTSEVHRDRLHAEYASLTRRLLDAGAGRVAWVAPPTPNGYWVSTGEGQEDDAWQQTSRDVFVAIADADDRVEVVDVAGWMRIVGLSADVAARPDGIHLAPEAARWVGARIYSELTS